MAKLRAAAFRQLARRVTHSGGDVELGRLSGGPRPSATNQTLTEHWNGTKWSQVPSPSPGSNSELSSVTATSASNAWAVGGYDTGTGFPTLIEHWNGTSWKHVPSPSPGSANDPLYAVAATSASNAWAVGYYYDSPAYKTLALHCC